MILQVFMVFLHRLFLVKPAHTPADTRDNIAGVCCLGLEVLSMMDDAPVLCTTVDSTQKILAKKQY